jgi:hypothetical protein
LTLILSNYEKHKEQMKAFRERITRKQAEEFGLVNQNARLQEKMLKQKQAFSKFLKGGKKLF